MLYIYNSYFFYSYLILLLSQQLWKFTQKTQSTSQGSKPENLDFLSVEMKGPDHWQALLTHNHIT